MQLTGYLKLCVTAVRPLRNHADAVNDLAEIRRLLKPVRKLG